MDQDLSDYVRNCLNQGIPKQNIEQTLLQTGWSKEDVDQAFNQVGQNQSPSISPLAGIQTQQQTKSNKKKWLYLGLFVLLVIIIGGTGGFLFIKSNKVIENQPIQTTRPDRTISLPSPSPIQAIQQPLAETCRSVEVLNPVPYKKMGFEICYPKNWVIDESGLAGTIVMFKNPEPDQEAKIPLYSNLSVLVSPREQNADLDKYINESKKGYPQIFKGYTIVEDKRVTINDKAVHILGGTYMVDILKIRVNQWIIIEGNKIYVVTATVLNSSWQKYQDLFDTTMQTFKII